MQNAHTAQAKHFEMDGRSLMELLDETAEKIPDKTCFVFEGEHIPYRDVMTLSRRIANGLIASSIRKGMRGAVFSPNDPHAFMATLGIIRAGAIWVPVNPRNSVADNAAVVGKFGCDALFYHSAFEDALPQILESVGDVKCIVCIDRPGKSSACLHDWAVSFSDADPAVPVEPTDIVPIPMTGGTTGIPKAVALSNRNFNALLKGLKVLGGGYSPVNLVAAPMTHVGGRIALTVMYRGGTSVILPGIDMQEILKAIEKYGVTDVFLPPTAIYMLLEQPNIHDFDLSSLQRVAYGSAPMSLEKLKQALNTLGPVMAGGFGQTECPMLITSLSPEDHFIDGKIAPDERLKSVGRETAFSTVRIMDENGQLLPPGDAGEVVVRGPMVSEGYFENPEATAEIRRDGWHLTGDTGVLDEDGFLTIVDRKKDMIITGGFNVYSAEVERALSTIPGVRDSVVIGVPDEKWGEAVKAVVQLDSGAELEETKIINLAKERLGGVKAPKSVDFVDELPRTANAKVDKKAIRRRYWEGAGRSI